MSRPGHNSIASPALSLDITRFYNLPDTFIKRVSLLLFSSLRQCFHTLFSLLPLRFLLSLPSRYPTAYLKISVDQHCKSTLTYSGTLGSPYFSFDGWTFTNGNDAKNYGNVAYVLVFFAAGTAIDLGPTIAHPGTSPRMLPRLSSWRTSTLQATLSSRFILFFVPKYLLTLGC